MKLSFSTLGCPDWGLERVVSTASVLGFAGVEIRGLNGRMELDQMPELNQDLPQTRARFRDAGVAVCCLSIGVSLLAADRAERRTRVDRVRRAVDAAALLGCPYVRVFGGRIPAGESRADAADDLAQALTALGGAADPKRVTVLLETHDDFCRGEHAADVVDRVAGPGVGVVWDIMHPFRCGEQMADTVNFLGDHIRHVHIKDGVDLSPTSLRPVLMGEGDVPIEEAVRLLRQNGYNGYLSLEWEKAWHPEIPGPETAFPQYVAYMRDLLRRIDTDT